MTVIKEEGEAAICLARNLSHHSKMNENSFSALIQSNFSGPLGRMEGGRYSQPPVEKELGEERKGLEVTEGGGLPHY